MYSKVKPKQNNFPISYNLRNIKKLNSELQKSIFIFIKKLTFRKLSTRLK